MLVGFYYSAWFKNHHVQYKKQSHTQRLSLEWPHTRPHSGINILDVLLLKKKIVTQPLQKNKLHNNTGKPSFLNIENTLQETPSLTQVSTLQVLHVLVHVQLLKNKFLNNNGKPSFLNSEKMKYLSKLMFTFLGL